MRGLGYITLRGFDFEQCANPSGEDFWKAPNPPQAGAVSTRSGHHWIIENNTIRFAQGIGLDCGREGLGRVLDGQTAPRNVGYHLIRGNRISDSGQCGIAGSGQFGNAHGVFNLRLDDGTKGNLSDHNFLAPAPNGDLSFQLNRYHRFISKIPANLLKVPLTLEQWRTLTGHDTASTLVTAEATMTKSEKPRIVVRTDPKITLDFPADVGRNLPYGLELDIHHEGHPALQRSPSLRSVRIGHF
jgi:hypothetical protein